MNFSESTVFYFRRKYLTKVVKRTKVGDSSAVTKLDTANRGQKVAPREVLDAKIKRYIQHLCENVTQCPSCSGSC